MSLPRYPTPAIKRRLAYTPPAFLIPNIALIFDLDEHETLVTATLSFTRQKNASLSRHENPPLVLSGRALTLITLALNGKPLDQNQYEVTEESLTIFSPEDEGVLTIVTRVAPATNTELYGLYLSSGVFCTQCEAEGFRRITYFLDRPDVLSRYQVEIRARRAVAHSLLSNGNLIASGELPDGRHFARWEDPFPKPCYLFALVAGNLEKLQDQFITQSGRNVLLEIYTVKENIPRCGFAMASLKRAMRWDEERYGREYDLDRFMIFCADDFNMGAMENKGLNIFNSALILADPATATDDDYHAIESVIAHEYFHNWTGNRVTCRDWFQLSLKEGLTVFRDQQFSSDMGDKDTERIAMVELLRQRQFPEDAGPTAHPIRPDEYQEINNFYTVTVYEKGAEVIRMLHTLLGEKAFLEGMNLYFARHDGQAVTCDDFVAAMQDASGIDLTPFKRWYAQAGTPRVSVATAYDSIHKTYTLTFTQATPPTPNQAQKTPVVIPINMALLDRYGKPLPLHLISDDSHAKLAPEHRVLILTKEIESFTFGQVQETPVPSLFRGGSAPVLLDSDLSFEAKATVARYETDGVARWDALRQLMIEALSSLAKKHAPLSQALIALYRDVLNDHATAALLRARALTFPDLGAIIDLDVPFNANAYHQALRRIRATLARVLSQDFIDSYDRERAMLHGQNYAPTPTQMARRKLAAFSLRAANGGNEAIARATQLYKTADNMTDTIAALYALRDVSCAARDECLMDFEKRWRGHPLVLDKYFALEATQDTGNALTRVHALMSHADFSIRNPNRVRALLGSFALRNFSAFHAENGEGYTFISAMIDELDSINPHSAAMLLKAFAVWRKLENPQRDAAQQALFALRGKNRSPELSELLQSLCAER